MTVYKHFIFSIIMRHFLKLAVLGFVYSASAFDLEDYATTYRATRDAYLKAANELKLATGPYKAARDAYVAATATYTKSLYERRRRLMDTDNLSLDDLEKLAGNPDLLFGRRLDDIFESDADNIARDKGEVERSDAAGAAAAGKYAGGAVGGGGTSLVHHQGRAYDYRNDKSLQDSLPDLWADTLQETVPDFWGRPGNPDNSFAVRAQSQASHTLSFAEIAPLVGHNGCITNMHSSLKTWLRPGTCACAFGDSGRRLDGGDKPWPTYEQVYGALMNTTEQYIEAQKPSEDIPPRSMWRNYDKVAADLKNATEEARIKQKPKPSDMIRNITKGQNIGYKDKDGNNVTDDGSPFNADYFLAPDEIKKWYQHQHETYRPGWKDMNSDSENNYGVVRRLGDHADDGLAEVRGVIKNTIFGTLGQSGLAVSDAYVEKAGELETYFENNIGNVMDQRKMACWCPKIEIKDWNELPGGTGRLPSPTYKPRCPRPTRRLLDYMVANPSKIMVDIHHYEEV
jgi:hypothetical protein